MAAPLGEHLVFDVQTSGTGLEVVGHRLGTHLSLSEAGVGVGDDGQVAAGIDLADGLAEFGQSDESDVREAPAAGDGRPRDIGRLEAFLGQHPAGEPVVGSGDGNAAGGERFSETTAVPDH